MRRVYWERAISNIGVGCGRRWRRYLANDVQSEWAARARWSLKFCEMQMHLSASGRHLY
jgi:hypothetical protein